KNCVRRSPDRGSGTFSRRIGDIQGFQAEPAVAADGAGRTDLPGMKSFRRAPLLSFIVRPARTLLRTPRPTMKVKVLGFRLSIKGKGFLGSSPQVENGDEIEATINEWLASHPGIRLVRVEQSVTGASGLGYQFLYLTVWHEDGA